jgi:hypothetical protein
MLAGALTLAMFGCAGEGPPAIAPVAGEPVGVQLKRVVPPLQTQRFSTLLDFETDADAVFVVAKPPGRMVFDRAHTGRRSMRFEPGVDRVAVKLSSLMSGRAFPGEWTLIGGFLYTDRATDVTLSIEGAGFQLPPRKVALTANGWTMALLDISPAVTQLPPGASPASSDARLVMTFAPDAGATFWCDDFVLINNAQTLVSNDWTTAKYNSTTGAPTTAPWSVSRVGLNYVGDMPRKFSFKLATADAVADGWRVEEANDLRARFVSEGGRTKHLTVYADGRMYRDGKLEGISHTVKANPTFFEQHDSPAQVEVPEELGRVNRSTEGDANNDGYNEQRGAYQLIATGPRLEIRLTPRTRQLLEPVLEISGLPAGNVLVTIEGKLVERTTRLDDGTLLVELPGLSRTTTVNLRVE